MRPTLSFLQYTARITLFSRPNCSLCDTAKATVNRLSEARSVECNVVDVMSAGTTQWKDLYEFDAPVVGLSYGY